MMHIILGVGIGILLINLIPDLNMAWLGVVLIVVALVTDYMRK